MVEGSEWVMGFVVVKWMMGGAILESI
jgi:hypothetical protein